MIGSTPDWTALSRTEKGVLIKPMIEIEQLSYSQIARIIGVSRVAIAGAADRNGITSPYSRGVVGKGHKGKAAQLARDLPARMAATKRTKPGKQPTSPKCFNKFVAAPIPDDKIDRTPLRKDAWTALPGTTPKPLDQHRVHECLWPIGEAPMLFCCEKVQDGSSWCLAHHKLAFKPRPAPKFNGRKTA